MPPTIMRPVAAATNVTVKLRIISSPLGFWFDGFSSLNGGSAWPGRHQARSHDLGGGFVAFALVVDPADSQLIAFLAAFEAKFQIRILGNGRPPIGDEHRLVAKLDRDRLDVVRRNDVAVRVLDEAGVHRMPNQCLECRGIATGDCTYANTRCHYYSPKTLIFMSRALTA